VPHDTRAPDSGGRYKTKRHRCIAGGSCQQQLHENRSDHHCVRRVVEQCHRRDSGRGGFVHCLIGALVVVVDVFKKEKYEQRDCENESLHNSSPSLHRRYWKRHNRGHNMYYNMYYNMTYNMYNTRQHVPTCNCQLQCRPVAKQKTSRPCMADNTAGVKGSGSCDRAFLGDDADGVVVWVAG
jgi:hypothetical protein